MIDNPASVLRTGLKILVITVAVFGAVVAEAVPRGPNRQPTAVNDEVLFEAGLARPLGELGEGVEMPLGLGAEDGYEFGFRWRHRISPRLSLAPAFHFTQFGSYLEEPAPGEMGETWQVNNYIIRYGLDLNYLTPSLGKHFRTFLSAGAGVCRNRYREEFPDSDEYYAANINVLAFQFGCGIRFKQLEVSALYNLNRCRSRRLPSLAGGMQDYNWDTLLLRIGWGLVTN